MTIREYLKSIGATENELSAKVVTRMEQKMLIDSDLSEFKSDTVLAILSSAVTAMDKAGNAASSATLNAQAAERSLKAAMTEAERELSDLKAQTAGLRDMKINSPETKDAVMAYTDTLNATKEIFGADAMNPDVIAAAIQAASYMAWRSIMGPKGKDDGWEQVYPRKRV